jgi:aryl-alcohol dehydrogenase-like predicted oxidoreductase
MQHTLLGTTGLLVSRLALGTMTFTDGSKTHIALHKVEEKLADELVGRASEAGINFIDTANSYGPSTQVPAQRHELAEA